MRILLTITVIFIMFSCKYSNNKEDKQKETVMVFLDTLKEFSSNKLDSHYCFVYKFQNIGENPLKLEGFHSSCGCSLAKLPQKQFLHNDTGSITVYFNPGIDTGIIKKSVYIVCNTKQKLHQLIFEGKIHP